MSARWYCVIPKVPKTVLLYCILLIYYLWQFTKHKHHTSPPFHFDGNSLFISVHVSGPKCILYGWKRILTVWDFAAAKNDHFVFLIPGAVRGAEPPLHSVWIEYFLGQRPTAASWSSFEIPPLLYVEYAAERVLHAIVTHLRDARQNSHNKNSDDMKQNWRWKSNVKLLNHE